MFSEAKRVGGHLIQALSICRRQVWLLSRGLEPEQDNDNLALGRLVDQNSYERERHQLVFGDNKFDFIQSDDEGVVVCEVKKSSRAEGSARLQLAHYLYDLHKAGIDASGLLMFPTEKRRVEVQLTDALKAELDAAYAAIQELVEQPCPPPAEMGKYCGKCAYSEYCWS